MYKRLLDENSWITSQIPVNLEYPGPGTFEIGESNTRNKARHIQITAVARPQTSHKSPTIVANSLGNYLWKEGRPAFKYSFPFLKDFEYLKDWPVLKKIEHAIGGEEAKRQNSES